MDNFFGEVVSNNRVDYLYLKQNPADLIEITKTIDNAQLGDKSNTERLAFYINAYNITVIKSIVLNYPLQSSEEVPGFFDQIEHKIAGKYMTLNDLENEVIRNQFKDPRIHFALVCGANGCPPIIDKCYRPESLEQQLDGQTTIALNNPSFIKYNSGENAVSISKIFDWYSKDFGKNDGELIQYINQYRNEAINGKSKISYYDYDWSLNGKLKAGSNAIAENSSSAAPSPANTDETFRYFVSALYKKGQYELNLFNNLYHEKRRNGQPEFNSSSTFFSSLFQFLYGINPRVNVGFDARFRSVAGNNFEVDSPFEVLKFPNTQATYQDSSRFVLDNYSRIGLTAAGPKIKYTPFKKQGNISIQHTLYIPLGNDLDGGKDFQDEKGYIDWNGFQLWTQIFYDQQLNSLFSIFVEADLNFENVGKDQAIQFSTPLSIIPSYFPNNETTIYGIINSSPVWFNLIPGDDGVRSFNPFSQYGLGIKYLFADKLQIEGLVTTFINSGSDVGRAATYNIGIRYIVR